jgi:hypothetical protein
MLLIEPVMGDNSTDLGKSLYVMIFVRNRDLSTQNTMKAMPICLKVYEKVDISVDILLSWLHK